MSRSYAYRRFILLCLVCLVLWWRIPVASFGLALGNAAYTHMLLILPISMALIVSERPSLDRLLWSPSGPEQITFNPTTFLDADKD
jgi:hypothetical protein